MKTEHVETILDSAKYLREIRPIAPAELVEYVNEDVEPGAIRDILHDHAVELSLYERSDGTFAPIGDEPVSPAQSNVDRFPPVHGRTLQGVLQKEYGDRWYDAETGDELREAIRSFKRAYFGGESVTYDRATALGYAIYHLPATYASTHYVLDEVASAGVLPRQLRVLDVGAGVGGQALALHDYLPDDRLVEYTAIEASDHAADLLGRFLEETGPNVHWSIDRTAIESAELAEDYDLVILANVLSEVDNPVAVVSRLAGSLATNGTILAIAPADERTSRSLRRIETAVLRHHPELDVFAPTLRLWPGVHPTDDCWSFEVRPDLAVPPCQRALDEGRPATRGDRDPATGEFVNVDVRFSYSLLRLDGSRRVAVRPSADRFVSLAQSEGFVTDRIDVAAVKLSHSLSTDEGANPLYVIGDGSQAVEHFAVLARETAANRHLQTADYGDVLLIRRGLLLWNDKEAAYNLVIDGETLVDRLTPEGLVQA